MRNNLEKTFIFMVVFLVLLSAFFVLDFNFSQNETRKNSFLRAYSTGDPNPDFSGNIRLYVEGNSPSLVGFLRAEIKEKLEERGLSVLEVESCEKRYESQALLVNVRTGGLYTPFYATSDPKVIFFYTSTGSDTEYFERYKNGTESIHFVNKEPDIEGPDIEGSYRGKKLVFGELEMQDSTKGIISKKAYRKFLAGEIAKGVVDDLYGSVVP